MSTPISPSGPYSDAALKWNQRFSATDFVFGQEPNAWLRQQVGALPAGGRVLSVADGEGRNSIWLAQQGFQVEAFDIAEVGVTKARAWAEREGVAVRYAVAGCDDYAWPEGALDGVVAIFVQFADPVTRERLFANMVRSLRPGGVLVLQGYTPRQLTFRTGGPPELSHLYTEDLLRTAFAGLTIQTLQMYETEVHEGQGHHGMSALVGLVASKPL